MEQPQWKPFLSISENGDLRSKGGKEGRGMKRENAGRENVETARENEILYSTLMLKCIDNQKRECVKRYRRRSGPLDVGVIPFLSTLLF